MDLKKAKKITNTFTQNGKTITPGLSDDWTYAFESYYNSADKLFLKSEKLNFSVFINLPIQWFFRTFIYTKKIIIDGDKLIGSFAFNKHNIYLEDEFKEALKIVEDSEMYDVIENNELIDFGVYLDDKGDEFVYLGNMAYDAIYLDGLDMAYDRKTKKRYISNYTNDSINYNNPIIQKNSKRKFIELIRTLNIKEKEKFLNDLVNSNLSNVLILSRKNGNELNILLENVPIYHSSIIKYNGTYGFYVPGDRWRLTECSFHTIDFELLCKDIQNNLLLSLDNYFIQKRKKFFISNKDEAFQVRFYLN